MKQVIKLGKNASRRNSRNAAEVRISIVENALDNTVELILEILPIERMPLRKAKRKKKTKQPVLSNGVQQYAARPVIGYMNIAQKIEIGRRIYLHMMSNTDFPDANPTPKSLLTATDSLDEAYDYALIGGEAEKRRLGRVEENFDRTYLMVVHYVDRKANGREEVYRSAGIEPILVYEKKS